MEQLEIALPVGAIRATNPAPADLPAADPAVRARTEEAAAPASADQAATPTEVAATPGLTEPAQPDASATAPAEAKRIPLWALLVADPGFAPEHLARAAVRDLGPVAADWAARIRLRYPDAGDHAVARLAAREFSRDARRIAVAASIGGIVGAVAASAALARQQARMVLTIAAAYRVDPCAEERGRELLTLLGVPRLSEPTRTALSNLARVLAAVVVRGLATRATPLEGAFVAAVQGGRSTEAVAMRALAHYGRRSTPLR